MLWESNSSSNCRLGIVLLSLLAGVLIGPSVRAEDDSAATASIELWYGTLRAEGRHFRFLITLTEEQDRWAGKLKSLDEGGVEFELDEVQRSEEQFRFELQLTNAIYTSKLDASGKVAEGTWKQRGVTLPLQLHRVDAPPSEPVQIVWEGTINALIQKLKVRFRELESGELYFDSVSQKVGGFVATKTVEDQQVTFDVPAIGGKFEGTIRDDGQRIVGKWKQGLFPLNLVLERLEELPQESASEPPPRPQTPQAPFPYQVEEVTFRNEQDDVTLAGTLTIPKDETSTYPAVVLISGSGPQDRDETILGHKPFWVIADYFSRNGIAVLRYDEGGVGKSSGTFAEANSGNFAEDVEAAIDFLRGRTEIDAARIGLCGHSEGGLVAPMVAARNDHVAFIVLMAGPGVNGEQIVSSQSRLILQASGVNPDEIERQSEMQRAFLELAKQRPLEKEAFLKNAQKALEPYLTEEEKSEGRGEQMAEAAFAQLSSPWFQFFMTHEPSENLEKVACPVLAINGELDLQVDPKLNLPAIEAALKRAPTTEFELVELPGLNHLFQKCRTGLVQEYGELEETIHPSALERMTNWIREQTQLEVQ